MMPRKRPFLPALVGFVLLGLVLSWYPWLLHLMGRPGNPGPNPLGLLLAALITVFVTDRMSARSRRWPEESASQPPERLQPGQGIGPFAAEGDLGTGRLAPHWREFLGQFVRLRADWRAWALTLGMPPVALVIAVCLAYWAGLEMRAPSIGALEMLDRFLVMLFFVGLGEEPAWRGFLQPQLQKKLPPWLAALAVAALWGFWHLPLVGIEFTWSQVPPFLLSVVAASVVLATIFNLSRSVLPPMPCHATVNTLMVPVLKALPRESLGAFWWIYALTWLALALAIVASTRGALGTRP